MATPMNPADMICYSLYSANHALTRTYRGLLEPLGLTYPQYLVLVALWAAETPQSVGQLGQTLSLDSGTLTPLLKRLEAAGLLTRSRNPKDERTVLVALTDQGRDMQRRAGHVPDAILAATGLDLDELADLRRRVSALRDRLID